MTALTVVIPAFKPDFLAAALRSLATQSVKDFEVLVADDGSPNALADIVRGFESNLRLAYHRFPDNLGGRSLVAHWSRSVRLTRSPWVWLFSDDDLADPGCVEVLLNAIAGGLAKTARIFHFNTRIVDHTGQLIRTTSPYPPCLSTAQFVQGRMDMRYSSFACEYAFSRAAFDEAGGFVEFPAAWCSDDASWIAFAGETDIVTLDGAMLSWRRSQRNISSPNSGLGKEKADAMIAYLEWLARRGIWGKGQSGIRWFLTLVGEQGIMLGRRRILQAAGAVSRFDGSARIGCALALLRSDLGEIAGRAKNRITS